MPNIKFSFLYRDAANYKTFSEVIFTNLENIPLEEIRQTILPSGFQAVDVGHGGSWFAQTSRELLYDLFFLQHHLKSQVPAEFNEVINAYRKLPVFNF